MRPPIMLLSALAILTLSLSGNAQEPGRASPPPPSAPVLLQKGGGPPSITVVDGVRDGKLQVRKFMHTQIPETYTVQETVSETVDGKTVNRTVNVAKMRMKWVSNVQLESYPLSDVQVFDTEGRPVARERIPALFSNPRIVLATIRGMTVDPAYMLVVRPGTYLVVLPLPPPPVMPMPVPAAAPRPMPGPAPAPAPRAAESPKADVPAPIVAPPVAPPPA